MRDWQPNAAAARAADAGYPESMYCLGLEAERRHDRGEAILWHTAAAGAGSAKAKDWLDEQIGRPTGSSNSGTPAGAHESGSQGQPCATTGTRWTQGLLAVPIVERAYECNGCGAIPRGSLDDTKTPGSLRPRRARFESPPCRSERFRQRSNNAPRSVEPPFMMRPGPRRRSRRAAQGDESPTIGVHIRLPRVGQPFPSYLATRSMSGVAILGRP